MTLPKSIFREYDIRGSADSDLTDETVEAIGKAFGTWLFDRSVFTAVVGGDVRLSTERIRASLIRGLLSVGLSVTDVGVVTTPMLYWSMYHLDMDGGVMVTGSHNPPDMNGMKLAFGSRSEGEQSEKFTKATLWGDDVQSIRKIARRGAFAVPLCECRVERDGGIPQAYLQMLLSKIKLKPGRKKLRVVSDTGNGTAGPWARIFFESLGCECISMYEAPDGRFPNHHPDPQKRENLTALAAMVKKTGADVGFAFDGDADRIGVVDELGNVIFGDRLMALYWREIMRRFPRSRAIVEMKCSMALPEEIQRLGGTVEWCKSGHSLIKAKMREMNAPFAGELSGHMFFADEYFGFDDSFYAAGRLLRIMSIVPGATLSGLMAGIPDYPATEEVRVPCPDSEKFAVSDKIRDRAVASHKCLTVDGVRIIYPNGWGLIRASNTQPVLTARCEGRDKSALDFIMKDVKARIMAEGLPDFEWTF
ncbi:MAG: phosphomannomutase/phosphoglucomutase [Synergistaceae bacterium]|jgi:phosphomannomutase/phosphoglucomutase|nr:phosphomannomutase/phosphoglucomutase [Synergistaceae bacterium]